MPAGVSVRRNPHCGVGNNLTEPGIILCEFPTNAFSKLSKSVNCREVAARVWPERAHPDTTTGSARGHSCPQQRLMANWPGKWPGRVAFRACCGQECPMPLGFDPPHPGGMVETSPTFQRWGREFRGAQVPKGRPKPGAIHQPSLRDLSCSGRWFPTLKRWAIIGCPAGTKTCPGLAYFVGANPSGIGR